MEPESASKMSTPAEKEMPTAVTSKPGSRRKTLTIIAISVGALLVVVVSFAAGFNAGVHKARFSYRFGENYERNFMKMQKEELRGKMIRKMDGKLFRSGHGVAGEVLSVTGDSIAIKGPEGQENSVTVSDMTVIMRGGDRISPADIKSGEKVVVLGKPSEDGTVKADFIRLLDKEIEQPDGPLQRLFR